MPVHHHLEIEIRHPRQAQAHPLKGIESLDILPQRGTVEQTISTYI